MTPEDYIKKYLPICTEIQQRTKIPAIAILAQVALETGWMKHAPGYNFFGIKARGAEKRQLLQTIEYTTSRKPPKVHKVISTTYNEKKRKYRHVVLDWFRAYNSEQEAWDDYTRLLLIPRYLPSIRWSYSPLRYLIANWRAGYATDPNYGKKMAAMIKAIRRRI